MSVYTLLQIRLHCKAKNSPDSPLTASTALQHEEACHAL